MGELAVHVRCTVENGSAGAFEKEPGMNREMRTRPLLIGVAVNGAEYSSRKYPFIPVTAEQAVNDAQETFEQGARYCHFHAREPRSGDQFVDHEWFSNVRDGMARKVPQAVISFASSRKGLVAGQIQSAVAAAGLIHGELSISQAVELELIRAIGMNSNPDLMTIFTALETKLNSRDESDSQAAAGSYQASATRGYTDPALISAYYQKVRGLYETRGIVPEYEITTMGAMWTLEGLIRANLVPQEPHFVFLFGFSARLPIAQHVFDLCMEFVRYLRGQYSIHPVVSVGAVIQPHLAATTPRGMYEPLEPGKHDYLELLEWALHDDTVDAIRVGLEDTPVHFGHSVTNADLVRLVRRACENAGVEITYDPSLVHQVFHTRCSTPTD
jgi:uncharacterized protein (DUF849 family)